MSSAPLSLPQPPSEIATALLTNSAIRRLRIATLPAVIQYVLYANIARARGSMRRRVHLLPVSRS
jgi:hypothetical protein